MQLWKIQNISIYSTFMLGPAVKINHTGCILKHASSLKKVVEAGLIVLINYKNY